MKRYKIFFLDHRSIYLNSLVDAMGQMGNEIYYQSSWNFSEIEAGIRYFRPDILLTVGCDIPLRDPSLMIIPSLCEKYGLFHIYWATEDKIHHEDWSLPFVQKIKPDLVWTIHPECVASYQAIGIPSAYVNFAFNPRMAEPAVAEAEKQYAISLIATTHFHKRTYRYESFVQLVVPLIHNHLQMDIWGFGWEQDRSLIEKEFGVSIPADWIHGYLPYKESMKVYQQSKIVLSLQNALDQVSQRTFEILGSGAFMLTNATPAIAEMFEDGVDLVMSHHPEETVELVKHYLDLPKQRQRIGQSARTKVLAQHTYFHRLHSVWEQLESSIESKRGART